jgi:hypothetical protein
MYFMVFRPFDSGTGLVRFHEIVGSNPEFSTSLKVLFLRRLPKGMFSPEIATTTDLVAWVTATTARVFLVIKLHDPTKRKRLQRRRPTMSFSSD